jgi:hypothetical protein
LPVFSIKKLDGDEGDCGCDSLPKDAYAIERYVAGFYPVIERQKRKPRSVSSRQELAALSRQLAEAVAQIDRLASGQSSLLADVQELKKK